VLTLHGDGLQTRVSVEDVVLHLRAGMEALYATSQASVFNVCTGRATSVLELAQTLARIDGRSLAMNVGPARAGDIRASLGHPGVTAVLGVGAKTGLEIGLAATVGSMTAA
jgi:UDP-glucose 4-epimerase